MPTLGAGQSQLSLMLITSVSQRYSQLTSSADARYSDLSGIAAKQMNIILDPLESKALVKKTCIKRSVPLDFIGRKEAKGAKLRYLSLCKVREL